MADALRYALRTVLALASGVLMIPGYFAGIVCLRFVAGWDVARGHLDALDDECIERGWWIHGPLGPDSKTQDPGAQP